MEYEIVSGRAQYVCSYRDTWNRLFIADWVYELIGIVIIMNVMMMMMMMIDLVIKVKIIIIKFVMVKIKKQFGFAIVIVAWSLIRLSSNVMRDL